MYKYDNSCKYINCITANKTVVADTEIDKYMI